MATIADDRIIQVYGWCKDAFRQHNRTLTFPKNTDPKKTYNWRYITSLAAKIDDLKLDDLTAQYLILSVADYANEMKLFNKGLSIYFQSNVIEICLNKLNKEDSANKKLIGSIRDSYCWLKEKIAKDGTNILNIKQNLDANPNIVRWHRDGFITTDILSLSKMCQRALSKLSNNHRILLPKDTELYLRRMKIKNQIQIQELKKQLGDDLI